MKKAICILILIAGAAGTAAAQKASDNEITWGYRNGRYWNRQAVVTKLGIIVGIGEGVRWVYDESDELIGPGTIGERIQALDDFYASTANLNIPIIAVQSYVRKKQKGVTAEELEADLSLMRKVFIAGTMTPPKSEEPAETNESLLPQRSKI